jgi:hypothetical protein
MKKTLLPSSPKPQTEKTEPETPIANSDDGEVQDISSILKKRPKAITPIEEEAQTETATPAEEKIHEEEKVDEDAADFEKDDTKKENPGGEKTEMFDSESFARTLVDIANFGREWFYPGVYDKYFFKEWELADLDKCKREMRDALKKNEEPKLSDYDKTLLAKEQELLKLKLKIPLKEEERAQLAKKVARHIAKIDWMAKLEKYDWIMLLVAFEGMRFMELKGAKKQFE